jgi:hypothetical protein
VLYYLLPSTGGRLVSGLCASSIGPVGHRQKKSEEKRRMKAAVNMILAGAVVAVALATSESQDNGL